MASSRLSDLVGLATEHAAVLLPLGLLSAILLLVVSGRPGRDEPPALKEAVPFFSNVYQYTTDLQRQIQASSHDILQFFLGPVRVYFVRGGKNVEAMFRKSAAINGDRFTLMAFEKLDGCAAADVKKIRDDKSGRLPKPAPGWEDVPVHRRFWAPMHEINHSTLIRTEASVHLAKVYDKQFTAALDAQPLGDWTTLGLYAFLKNDMGRSACVTMVGSRCLELEPGYLEKFWEFDNIAFQCVFGKPSWLDPRPTRIRDEFNRMGQGILNQTLKDYDWDGPAMQLEWEPTLGSRYIRSLLKLSRDHGFSVQSMAGMYGGVVFGVNSNAIPITAWAMYEIIRDPSLYRAVRAEAQSAMHIDPETGKKAFQLEKLMAMPLLQSIYTEALRLNVCVNVTREVVEPTELNGYKLRKGALLQAPTVLPHFDDQIWGKEGHKASEFWAERHVKEVNKVDEATGKTTTVKEFALAARPSEFFPYGGGLSICAGRFFAKREILLTIAMLVTRFDMEFVEWTKHDGSSSDRAPLPDPKYFGAAAVPPDRDMKVRWKRIW
ncbi:cytochrome P450 [Thozetella sp. PMI_491]|nr:cytochrome P450 [Thozetella sp. PMI_491]